MNAASPYAGHTALGSALPAVDAAVEGEDASNRLAEPAIAAMTTTRPATRLHRIRVVLGHAAIQGRALLPARMWFSICRRYAPALASEQACLDRRGRALHGRGHPRRPPSRGDRGRHR